MKKYFFLISVAALAMTACTNESDEYVGSQEAKEIAFTPFTTPQTRAAIQSEVFPTTNTMEIAAYQSSATAGNYFTKMTFEKDGDVWTGGASPKYWPLSAATLNFFAISAAKASTNMTASHITIADNLGTASVAYTTGNGYDETSQYDIVYAFNRGSVTQSGNALLFNGGTTEATSSVAMQFKHALALINFQIKAGDDASTAIAIKKVELNGACYTGTLNFANTNASAVSGEFSTKLDWTSVTSAQNNIQVPNIGNTESPVPLTTSYVPANTTTTSSEGNAWAALMVVPSDQTTPSPTQRGFTSFTITYTFNGKIYTYTYAPAGWTDHDTDPETPDVASQTVVEAGKKYTYQITMTLHEITVTPTVESWTEQNSENNVNI